jgi:hypothetical protein
MSQTSDAVGNRTGLSANFGGTLDFVNVYQYDNLDRMTQVTQTSQSGGNAVADKRVDLSYLDNGLLATISRYSGLSTSDPVAESTYGYGGVCARYRTIATAAETETWASAETGAAVARLAGPHE